MNKLDNTFLQYASEILADTEKGLSGSQIVEYCNSYALQYNKKIPYSEAPFPKKIPNKRTALKENLSAFEAAEQFSMIKELSELSNFTENEKVKELRLRLFERYGNLAKGKISETELIQTTKHWLSGHPRALKQYESALSKFEGGIFERNTLDDMRLSFELLVKDLLHNEKSLENQIIGICGILDECGTSVELKNMVQKIVNYYAKFQNNHVKHNDAVNENEIGFVIELTSVIMKFLIKASGENTK